MFIIFYSTNDVYAAEELLQSTGVSFEIIPTPLKESVYCGVCIKTDEKIEIIENMLHDYRFKVA